MPNLTIKKLDAQLLERLREQARRRGMSLNGFVRQALARCVGFDAGVERFTDLSDLAGAWSEQEEQEFLDHTAPLREVDESQWR
jgi:Antitoxin FitA-like, ribbon-helix-helix